MLFVNLNTGVSSREVMMINHSLSVSRTGNSLSPSTAAYFIKKTAEQAIYQKTRVVSDERPVAWDFTRAQPWYARVV